MVHEVREGLRWLPECYPVDGDHEHVAVYCLERAGSHVLVDTGSFHHRGAILEGVEAATGGAGPDALVLSHTDYPHAANWAALRERWGDVELVASSATPSIQGLPADARRCDVGGTLDVCGSELRFVDPPLADRSHTTWVYDPGTRTLFTADGFGARHEPGQCDLPAAALPDGRVPAERVHEHHAETLVWLQYADPAAVCEAVEAVFERLDVEVVAPTHGPPVAGEAIADYLADFRAAVVRIVAETDPGAGETLYSE